MIKAANINTSLEERMLYGKNRNDVIAASVQAFTGTVGKPLNSTEILMRSESIVEGGSDPIAAFLAVAKAKAVPLI